MYIDPSGIEPATTKILAHCTHHSTTKPTNRVDDVPTRGRILALIEQCERDAMTERPREQRVEFALQQTNEQRHILATN